MSEAGKCAAAGGAPGGRARAATAPAYENSAPAGRGDAVAAYLCRRFPGFAPDAGWVEAAGVYPPNAAPEYLSLIRSPADHDPVFRQVAPSAAELDNGGGDDPVRESDWSPVPGLIRRYPDRALVMPTSGCFMRCRHCMRKRSWGAPDAATETMEAWRDWLRSNPGITEVIISGGDPLTLADDRLARLLDLLLTAKSVKELRVHSRAVVAAPSRITPRLAALLAGRKVRRLVTQANHPVEVTAAAGAAAHTLTRAGIAVENQAVLLRGVNDRPETLAQLFRSVRAIGVRPYYLHHPDRVRGAMHFTLGLEEGWSIYQKARRLAGDPVPAYVVDRPGSEGKVRVEELIWA
ncbi:MAG TPA: KamA family radical SAM protein [bacterium]|nr:KamA family radical SAM protein [bacterium]